MLLNRQLSGTLLVLLSAVCFGTLAVFAKVAYAAGLVPEQLLALRFQLGALGMVGLALITRQNPLTLPRRSRGALLAMGGIGYAGQAACYFFALRTLPASLVGLLLYTYPALVTLGAFLLYRRPVARSHLLALAGTFLGVLLLVGTIRLAGGPGLLFAIAAPVIYTAYILAGERVMPGQPAIPASAVTLTGAALTWTAVAFLTRHLQPPQGTQQVLIVVGLALIPTMLAITAFLAALPHIGAGRAALLSSLEPVVVVLLAVLLLGDRFQPLQLVGAALVLASVLALQWPQHQDGDEGGQKAEPDRHPERRAE